MCSVSWASWPDGPIQVKSLPMNFCYLEVSYYSRSRGVDFIEETFHPSFWLQSWNNFSQRFCINSYGFKSIPTVLNSCWSFTKFVRYVARLLFDLAKYLAILLTRINLMRVPFCRQWFEYVSVVLSIHCRVIKCIAVTGLVYLYIPFHRNRRNSQKNGR